MKCRCWFSLSEPVCFSILLTMNCNDFIWYTFSREYTCVHLQTNTLKMSHRKNTIRVHVFLRWRWKFQQLTWTGDRKVRKCRRNHEERTSLQSNAYAHDKNDVNSYSRIKMYVFSVSVCYNGYCDDSEVFVNMDLHRLCIWKSKRNNAIIVSCKMKCLRKRAPQKNIVWIKYFHINAHSNT